MSKHVLRAKYGNIVFVDEQYLDFTADESYPILADVLEQQKQQIEAMIDAQYQKSRKNNPNTAITRQSSALWFGMLAMQAYAILDDAQLPAEDPIRRDIALATDRQHLKTAYRQIWDEVLALGFVPGLGASSVFPFRAGRHGREVPTGAGHLLIRSNAD